MSYYDKPTIKNTAPLMNPINSESDAVAEEYRNRILNSPNNVIDAKKIWYISENGDDSASGSTPAEAWKTLQALANHEISYGDAVLLERGGVYRGHIVAESGVYYGAYGEGDKPCIYGSAMNYLQAEWEYKGDNIWCVETPNTTDIGIVVINHGEKVAFRKKTIDDLKENDNYYYENQKVFYYSEKPPVECYNSIEMGDLGHLLWVRADFHDITVENITFKYGGSMAIMTSNGSKNITVRNCEIGWIGGCYLPNYKDGTVRYGNGIESWNGCDNILVEDCWVYQIYDSGLSHQGNGVFLASNVTYRRNLIEYTSFASIEYWAHDANKNSMENITYEDNVLRFAGYGWGDEQRPNIVAYHILSTGNMDHKCTNFKISGNVMDLSTRGLIRCTSKIGTYPEIDGNTYIQTEGGMLGAYGDVSNPIEIFSCDVSEKIKTLFGDNNAKVKYL